MPDDNHAMAALNVSDPARIIYRTSFDSCGIAWHQAEVAGDTLVVDAAYPQMNGREICFYSLGDPLSPHWFAARAATENPQFSPRVATRGNLIVVAESYNGATVLNPDDLSGAPLGVYSNVSGSIFSVAAPATGNLLLAAAGDNLLLIDLSNPAKPELLGKVGGAYGGDMNASGDLVFVYNWTTKALDIVDIHDPESPQILASHVLPGDNANRILPVGNLVFVANDSAGVRVIDVSTPTAPKEVAFYDPPAPVSDLAVEGNHVYLAANELGLMVLQLDEDILLPPPSTLSLPFLVR
jgi:hypothetical protein